jgi:hypothetical protein
MTTQDCEDEGCPHYGTPHGHTPVHDISQDAEKLVKIYRKIRSAREDATAAHKKQHESLTTQMESVSRMLMDLMDKQNVLGMKTAYGNVSKVVKQRFWNTDWESFNTFVKEHDLLDLYEKRIAQKNMAEWIEKNPGQIPPGLQIDRSYDVLVVKPRTKPE